MIERHHILNDEDFWTRLEYDATGWLENSDDRNLRRFWIDGFSPYIAKNTKFGADFEGVAWVGRGGREQWPYWFIVSVPQKMLHRRAPSFTIETLSLDEKEQMLRIVLAKL